MRLRALAAFSMTLGILAATIGFAGLTSAAPAGWVMPNLRGVVLNKAVKSVREVTGSQELYFRLIDKRNGQEVHNQTMWEVCAQNPRAGQEVAFSPKKQRILFFVKRFNQRSCWK